MSDTPTYRNSLTLGSMLHEYRLDSVLGAGGFGMTYLGWDVNLEKHVACREIPLFDMVDLPGPVHAVDEHLDDCGKLAFQLALE